jgi:hypothetical protein
MPVSKFAFVRASRRGETDRVLRETAMLAAAQGLKLCGAVQSNTEIAGGHHCDMDLQILPEGPEVRISQRLGSAARGCRLDPGALEEAVGLVQMRLPMGVDALILNKFGKHEAAGRGFREIIAWAVAEGKPVLVGVNDLNIAAFQAFVGEIAEELPADPRALCRWMVEAVRPALAEVDPTA